MEFMHYLISKFKRWTSTQNQRNVSQFSSVIQGIAEGSLNIGSVSPVVDVPKWVSLEVGHGGFATGKLPAELEQGDCPNETFLTAEGMEKLYHVLASTLYEITYSENAALPILAYLRHNGYSEEADKLLEEISPYLKKLKFYPNFTDEPNVVTKTICMKTVGNIQEILTVKIKGACDLNRKCVRNRVSLQEACTNFFPLKQDLIALILQTFPCKHFPKYSNSSEPQVGKSGFKKGTISQPCTRVEYIDCHCGSKCGLPFEIFPEGWYDKARSLLHTIDMRLKYVEYKTKRSAYNLSIYIFEDKEEVNFLNSRFSKKSSMLNNMIVCLKACLETRTDKSKSVDHRLIARLNDDLATFNSTRGLPGSSTYNDYIEHINVSRCPSHKVGQESFIKIILDRLKAYDPLTGLENPDDVLAPFEQNGKTLEIPDSLANLVKGTLKGTVSELVAHGIVLSCEDLASIVPQLTAQTVGCFYSDSLLNDLITKVYVTFRKRKSLLLTEGGQLRFFDLPFVKALESFRSSDIEHQSIAYSSLVELVTLALVHYPQTKIPNKLLQSIRELMKSSGLGVYPLTDELAFDIFRGNFSSKFVSAAGFCSYSMNAPNNFYSRYYDLVSVYKEIRENKINLEDFKRICFTRAEVSESTNILGCLLSSCKVISQQQLITNPLCIIIDVLDIKLDWADLARRVWTWIIHNINRRNISDALRQLVYFISLLNPQEQKILLDDLKVIGIDNSSYEYCYEKCLIPLIQVYESCY